MEFEKIICEKDGQIGRITLNWPEKLNPWNPDIRIGLSGGFTAALDYLEEDDDIKVVLIKGAGKCFSAGADLNLVGSPYGMGVKDMKEGRTRRPSQRIRLLTDTRMGNFFKRLFLYPKITIAQVHGHCIGIGVIIVNCCDLAIAAEDAEFSRRDQRLGFAGNAADFIQMVYNLGLKRSLGYLLTGEPIDGTEAARVGLVNKAVPFKELDKEATKLCESITLLPRDGIVMGKAMRELAYETLGLNTGLTQHHIGHAMFTNIRWEADEYNYFKKRLDDGSKSAFQGRDARYSKE